MNNQMKSAYVLVNGVPTNILTWGRWIEESLDDVKEIVICITGNPGLPGFYTEFASTVYKSLGVDIPVWVIGHAGHDEPSMTSLHQTPELQTNEKLYNLPGQVIHKLDFVEKYVPKNVKINWIGHSIGAWMVLESLKHNSIKSRTKKCYLLFPTIERMAESSNGKLFEFSHLFAPIYMYLLQLIYMLPSFIRLFIITIYFWLFSIPKMFLGTAMKYSKPASMKKVIFLAKDEMNIVRQLDEEHIKNTKHLLKLYYGTTDGWVPIKYYEEIIKKIPDLDAKLCERQISHSFVLRESEIMGKLVANWITEQSNFN